MKVQKSNRLLLRLKLKKDGRVVESTTQRSNARVFQLFQEKKKLKMDSGVVRVVYNRRLDYWNEFEFENMQQLKEQLAVCTEPRLVEEFTCT